MILTACDKLCYIVYTSSFVLLELVIANSLKLQAWTLLWVQKRILHKNTKVSMTQKSLGALGVINAALNL